MTGEEAFAELGKQGSFGRLRENQMLWKSGDPGDGVVMLVDGLLEVLHTDADGEEVVFRLIQPGGMVGEIAATDGQARSASVRAISDCQILRVPTPVFHDLIEERPELCRALLAAQLSRVRDLSRKLVDARHTASSDALTGLYNMGFFRERLQLELRRAREADDPVSLVIFDVDHFKGYNDHHGHEAGSQALAQVARVLKGAGRRCDVLARYGGEEFVALLYGTARGDAVRFAEAARAAVEATALAVGEGLPPARVTVSAGVASFPVDGSRSEALIESADRCLYRAKEEGRNRVVAAP